MRRSIVATVVLLALFTLTASILGWRQSGQTVADSTPVEFPSCSSCSVAKRDLADQVRRRAEQKDGGSN